MIGVKLLHTMRCPLHRVILLRGRMGPRLLLSTKGMHYGALLIAEFGDGVRYVDIVRRNQRDIVDPDLIYPKQIFAVPRSAKDKTNQN